jgi:glucosamine kinase
VVLHLGKTFIQALLNEELSAELKQQFGEKYQLSLLDILDAVYKKPLPNRFLAQFAPFVLENKQHSANGSNYKRVLRSVF